MQCLTRPTEKLSWAGEARPQRSRPHLKFLDGIRGIAALYVVFHHAYIFATLSEGAHSSAASRIILQLLRPLSYGHYAVDMFIVLSGYCLMLPVLGTGGVLKGGINAYVARRARRILPPYYGALLLSVLLVFGFQLPSALEHLGDNVTRPIGAADLAAHLLLVHNLVDHWSYSINPPMWSVASEWQIYFVFPLVLLPLWRRLGPLATVALGLLGGISLHLLIPGGLPGAAPWFIGLFTMGMLGAALSGLQGGSPFERPGRWRWAMRPEVWGIAAAGLALALVVMGIAAKGWFLTHPWVIDPLFGLASMCALVYCARSRDISRGLPGTLRGVLQSRGVMALGAFSYSLYLTHYPILELFSKWLRSAPTTGVPLIAMLMAVYVPISLGFAYLFHLCFERPFMLRQTSGPIK